MEDDITWECPKCNGDGAMNGVPCETCNGFGYFESEEELNDALQGQVQS